MFINISLFLNLEPLQLLHNINSFIDCLFPVLYIATPPHVYMIPGAHREEAKRTSVIISISMFLWS